MENLDFYASLAFTIVGFVAVFISNRYDKFAKAKLDEAKEYLRQGNEAYSNAIKLNYEIKGKLDQQKPSVEFRFMNEEDLPQEVKEVISNFVDGLEITSKENDILRVVRAMNYEELTDLLDDATIDEVKKVRRLLSEVNENEKVSMVDGYLRNREKK